MGRTVPRKTRRARDKLDHISAALDGASEVSVQKRRGALGFEDVRFSPATLPNVNLEEIDLFETFLGKRIAAPLMISPMTGGVDKGRVLNLRMARAAEEARLPFAVGSQRVALEDSRRAKTFEVRKVAPTIPIFANLGAVQLVRGFGVEDAARAVDMIDADALFLHLNAMQEAVQPGGDTTWADVLSRIEALCGAFARQRRCPVFVREVGFGIPADQAKQLLAAGVSGIDCAGGGGTSWTLLEGRIAEREEDRTLGAVFADWGLTTVESLIAVRSVAPKIPVIASGGLRSGLDVAKCVALGATLGGMAAPVLRAAEQGEEPLRRFLVRVLRELRVTLFGVGAPDLASFRKAPRLLLPASELTARFSRC